MNPNICPYPGLRPFNEEESIFFKGREQQVERLVKRLEEKKFLMVNGASGDGKSSLIYAGVIPYAKAGFFKARYNNWIVADFRPERSPLKNLTASICKQLKIEDTAKTEKELGYGFSALCDLYKASSFYIDENQPEWLNADEKERKVIKRKGANLLVLVDQFEEFFTNPENYQNGIPSIESQKAVNLLLETYKLAAAQDLPIYVVCTMRSDYIGQCAAFRGLPEAIGYSQFFVPRLKRQEIEQVIEGPAELAGCRISKRLTQTLLNSLTDGFDQLPILQHALNHIWKAANNGKEELDLIHLAMVGGVSAKFLSVGDKAKFEDWCKTLPDYKLQLLEKPSLSNVLNAHANELYLTAHLHYKHITGNTIPIEQAQKIIKVVFQCLTKVDASRAVRNRMTLQEITHIINDEKVSITKVDQLLQIYRQQGNTFLQPFIGDEGQNKDLTPSSVLDITHESLIRNWVQLTEWANEEFENLQNYLDFDKQLQRWVNSNKNNGYLLPIGPLSFFENWFEKLNPSKYWIHRYEDFEGEIEKQLEQAEVKLTQAKEFIEKSAKKLIFTRTVLKYGAQRIAIAAGVLLLISLCTYYYFDYRKKQNNYVINELLVHGKEMLTSKNVSTEAKADFILNNDRLNELSNKPYEFVNLLNGLENDTLAFDIGYAMITKCLTKIDSCNYDKKGEYSMQLFDYLYRNFENEISLKIDVLSKGKSLAYSKFNRNRLNDFLGICALMKHDGVSDYISVSDTIINKTIFKAQWFLNEAIKSKEYQKHLVEQDVLYTFSTLIAIDDSPNYSEIIHLLSPLEGDAEANMRFDSIFKSNEVYKFNCMYLEKQGGFHLLALLYATQFKTDITAKEKIEMLIDFNLFQNIEYAPLDIYLTLYKFNGDKERNIDFVIDKLAKNDWTKAQYVGNAIQNLFQKLDVKLNFPSNFINCFISTSSAVALFDRGEKMLLNNTLNDSTKMNLAVFYKKRGFYYSEYLHQNSKAEMNFSAALNYYQTVTEEHKLKTHYYDKVFWNGYTIPNYKWFLSPGIYNEYIRVFNNCSSSSLGTYMLPDKTDTSSPFLKSLIKKENFYTINSSTYISVFDDYTNYDYGKHALGVMQFLSKIENKSDGIDLNLLFKIALYESYLMFKNNEFERGNIKLDSLFKRGLQYLDEDYSWIEANALLLAQHGDTTRTLKLLRYVQSAEEKNKILLKICYQLQEGPGVEFTYFYLNQLLRKYSNDAKIGMALYRVLGKIGGYDAEKNEAREKYRNTPELMKPKALQNWVLGTAENGNYYKAKQLIPENVSETKELILMNQILSTEIIKQSKKSNENAWQGNWNDARYFDLDLFPGRNNNDFQFNSLE
jgi:hypothetical protein